MSLMDTFRRPMQQTQQGSIKLAVLAVLVLAIVGAAVIWFGGGEQGDRGAPSGPPRFGGAQEVGVLLHEVATMNFAEQIEALGTAKANESVDITAKVSGLVAKIQFREGQRVRSNAVLLELESKEAQANLAEAEAALVESRAQYERSRALFDTQAVSQASLDELQAQVRANEARVQAASARLDDYVIRAPFGGRVGLRNVSPGSLISPGQVITTLDDTSTIKLDFSIPETFLAGVAPGMDIAASSAAYPEVAFAGQVASIDTRVDPLTRSVAVRAEMPNDDGILKPGMFLTVTLFQKARPALAVPEQALLPEEDRQFVFVVTEGIARRRQVVTGQRRPGWVEVVSGLEEGELVITEGTQRVRDGSAVRSLASLPGSPGG